MRILPIDELNILKGEYGESGTPITDFALDDIIEDLLDIFLLAMARGVLSVNEQFGTEYKPSAVQVEKTIYEKIDGVTWEDRVRTWYENGGTTADVIRIAETESHRIGNEAAYTAAKEVGATRKTWLTMLDDRVRDTHAYLEGVTVGINDYFYSYKGGQTLYPGQWGIAEEDCGCRCEIAYT